MRLPGAAAKCVAQSKYASANAAGDRPAVKWAAAALRDRSTTSPSAVDAYESRSSSPGRNGADPRSDVRATRMSRWPLEGASEATFKAVGADAVDVISRLRDSC